MILLYILLHLTFSTHAALDARYDDFEDFDLVRALVDDNKLDLAQNELNQMRDRSSEAQHKYWSGVVSFKKGKFEAAESALQAATFAKDSEYHLKRNLYLGRSQHQTKHFRDCAEHLQTVVFTSVANDSDAILLAHCERENKSPERAWSVLAKSLKQSNTIEVLEATVGFLADSKMFQVATDISLEWLALRSTQSADFLSIATLFTKAGSSESALKILELARLKYPLDIDINLNLNQIYYEKGMLLAVEEGFARASQTDTKYAYHAAEINRQVGRYERSQFFNSRIPDEKERLKQKLAIYVDKGQFAMIASMESILQRSPLINDDEIRYALSYSLVRMGEYKRPLKYLAQITNKDFLEKTVILRNALTDCVQNNKICKL